MAQKVSELMTSAPVTLRSGQPLTDAAKAMREHGIGDVLVVDHGQLKGLVTDRDIMMRAVADGRDPMPTVLGAYEAFDRREPGWTKVTLGLGG